VFLALGRPEQWTLSVAHTPEDVDVYVAAFAELCAELSGGSGRRADDRAANHLAAT
jgi:hypothetical protein